MDISDIANPHLVPENEVKELRNYLPPGHKGYMEADPVVSFMHTSTVEEGRKVVHLYPITPNSTGGGFNEIIDLDEEILGFTKAEPGGLMYSLYIEGPLMSTRLTVGYSYLSQTPIDWQQRAIMISSLLNRSVIKFMELSEAAQNRGEKIEELIEKMEDESSKKFVLRFLETLKKNGD